MKTILPQILATVSLVVLSGAPSFAEEDGNWKLGRIYYRAACTACHEKVIGHSISPAEKTIAEWKLWAITEQGSAHLDEYVSQDYRNLIAGENKVAAKFAPIPNADMRANVRAFVVHGAKDSATPATCN